MNSLGSIEIDRPIGEVFTYTNEKLSEWSLTVVEDEVIEDKGGVERCLCVALLPVLLKRRRTSTNARALVRRGDANRRGA